MNNKEDTTKLENNYLKHNEFETVGQNDINAFHDQSAEVNYKVIKKLSKVSIFCTCFMIIEFVGGYLAGSLAIMTDAAHLLSDLSGFLISMFSLYIALRPANNKLTYGYHRAEVIGALSSILIIWVLTVWLISQAIYRLFNPHPIQAIYMMGIATLGLIFNLIMSKILTSDNIPNAFEKGDDSVDDIEVGEDLLNSSGINEANEPLIKEKDNPILKAAFVHILGDILQSVGVLIAATIIYFFQDSHPKIEMVDPLCTFIFAIIVLSTSIPVSRDCINVLMEATPSEVDIVKLTNDLKTKVVGVENVHDIHVWNISVGKPSISLHILSNLPQKSLEQATNLCKKYGIYHTTIQVEDNTQRRRPSFVHCTHGADNTIHQGMDMI